MAKLEEIQRAINNLPEEYYRQFRNWFLERDGERWDRQIIEDSKAGKLNFLITEALNAKKENKLRDL
ncbi:hypothetical protein [Desulfoferrobacter suflitae]|uniref:hypothetical protein n=1 Tax=Desulfoferrobacter suflitae TaxID=2865782 RepID=UPI002164690C|nr:hypothetical protein [Desulfoferrobacter suflitae]MCK8600500.1 hypothetical protein [Desulfoferrobacter suflitae]